MSNEKYTRCPKCGTEWLHGHTDACKDRRIAALTAELDEAKELIEAHNNELADQAETIGRLTVLWVSMLLAPRRLATAQGGEVMDKCPFCSAAKVERSKHPVYAWEFHCGSYGDEGYMGRSERCKEDQLDQLQAQLADRNEIITNFQKAFLWIETSWLRLTPEEEAALKALKEAGEWPNDSSLFVVVEAAKAARRRVI